MFEVCLGEVKRVEKVVDIVLCNICAPGEVFHEFVGVFISGFSHDGLHGFAEDFPGVFEIAGNGLFIDSDLAQTIQDGFQGETRMADGRTNIATGRRIGQVALKARDGQFGR